MSFPLIQNIDKKNIEIKNTKSENINKINNDILSSNKEEENKSNQIINPFDSIVSKKIKLNQIFYNNNNIKINQRYSKNYINNSLSNSNGFKACNNFSYSLSSNITNKDKNTNTNKNSIINDSSDINFEIINNEESNNFKNSKNIYTSSNISNNNINKKKEEFITIKENEEEEYNNDEDKADKAEIHLEDIESYVNKYSSNKNNLKYFTKYELNKRLSDIINNSPFENINNEINIEKLISKNNINNIKNIDIDEIIIKKFDEDFYSKILSTKNFSIINEILHNTENFEKNKNIISISSLYTYNGKNKNLKEKKIRDITNNDGNSFIKGFIFNYIENIIAYKYINKIIFIIYIIYNMDLQHF